MQAPRHQRCLGLTWQDRYLAVVKMSFFWEREICLVMLCLGATIVVNRARTLAELVAHIRTGRITTLALTPAHLAALLDHPADTEPLLPTVRAMVVGSAPLTHERRLQVRRKLTPNVIVSDIALPDDGLLLVRDVREMGLNIPVIATTAHIAKYDRTTLEEFGFIDVLYKPLSPDDLCETVAGVARRRGDG